MRNSLADIQSAFQKAIVENSADADHLIAKPPSGNGKAAFKVYQEAYILRLTGFLANDFPLLKEYLGDVEFNAIAQTYIASQPSTHPNARWYSNNFPSFLKTSDALAEHGEGVELAALEFALLQVFDAADVPALNLADLAALPPERAGDLHLRLQPSVRILSFRQNTISIWSALKAESEPPFPHMLDLPQKILVFRQDQASRFRLLGDAEAMALAYIRDGVCFAILCELMAFQNDDGEVPQRAAMFLRIWTESQLLVGISDITAEK